MHPCGSIA